LAGRSAYWFRRFPTHESYAGRVTATVFEPVSLPVVVLTKTLKVPVTPRVVRPASVRNSSVLMSLMADHRIVVAGAANQSLHRSATTINTALTMWAQHIDLQTQNNRSLT